MICQRCESPDHAVAYQVVSEDGEKKYLDMLVCGKCARDAENLGLQVTPISKKAVFFLLEE